MGTQLSSILSPREIKISDLAGKRLVIDAFNNLYQYLSTIRQPDGTPLKDSKGNVTSHLSGIFFRTARLMGEGIKVAFVFDGVPPKLKKEEQERRRAVKEKAIAEYRLAVEKQDIALMRKYASRTSILSSEMIEEAKALISALGIPIIQAPSEGEAQAAHMVHKGDFYGVITQDTDALLFGAPRVVKNLTISQKKRLKDTKAFVNVTPEMLELSENLAKLGISREQLIAIGMLCGTDFNIGGVKGIGPKKALILAKKHGSSFDSLFNEAKWSEQFTTPWQEIFSLFSHMPVADDYTLRWGGIDREKVFKLMVDDHEFSRERIEKALEPLSKSTAQRGLSDFF